MDNEKKGQYLTVIKVGEEELRSKHIVTSVRERELRYNRSDTKERPHGSAPGANCFNRGRVTCCEREVG